MTTALLAPTAGIRLAVIDSDSAFLAELNESCRT
jgi:hypothetical protein